MSAHPIAPLPLIEHLQQAGTFLLITHVSPDSDAIGSLLGLTHALRLLGKNCDTVVQRSHPGSL